MKLSFHTRIIFLILAEYYAKEKQMGLTSIIYTILADDKLLPTTFELLHLKTKKLLNVKQSANVTNTNENYHYLVLSGLCYRSGLLESPESRTDNRSMALKCLQIAHNKSILIGTAFLGYLYTQGDNLVDVKKGKEYLMSAANQGLYVAEILLLMCGEKEIDELVIDKNISIFFPWYISTINAAKAQHNFHEKTKGLSDSALDLAMKAVEENNFRTAVVEEKIKLLKIQDEFMKSHGVAIEIIKIINEWKSYTRNSIGDIDSMRGDYKSAIESYESSLDSGNSAASLASLYYEGTAVKQDLDKAVSYLQLSLSNGSMYITENLIVLLNLLKLEWSEKDLALHKAFNEIRSAVEKPTFASPFEIYNLAFFLYHNLGLDESIRPDLSLKRAIPLLERSEKLGHRLAALHLAYCNEFGLGTPQNFTRAFRFYNKVETEEDSLAEYSLQPFIDQKKFNIQYIWSPLQKALENFFQSSMISRDQVSLIAEYSFDWQTGIRVAAREAKKQIQNCLFIFNSSETPPFSLSNTAEIEEHEKPIEERITNLIAEYSNFFSGTNLINEELKGLIFSSNSNECEKDVPDMSLRANAPTTQASESDICNIIMEYTEESPKEMKHHILFKLPAAHPLYTLDPRYNNYTRRK